MFGPITTSLWTLNFILLVAVLYLLLRRRKWKEYPVFVALIATSVCCSGVMQVMAAFDWRVSFFYFGWFSRSIQGLLSLAAVHEVLRKVLYSYDGLRNLASTVYWLAIVVLLAGAAVTAATLPNHGWIGSLTITLGSLDRTLLLLSAGLMFIVFALVAVCGMSWGRLVFGIALGLGMHASVKLALVTVYSYAGMEFYGWYTVAVMINGVAQAAIWLVYAAVPARETAPQVHVTANQLHRWNSALLEVLQR